MQRDVPISIKHFIWYSFINEIEIQIIISLRNFTIIRFQFVLSDIPADDMAPLSLDAAFRIRSAHSAEA